MIRSCSIILHEISLLSLLIDSRGQAFDDRRFFLVIVFRQREHIHISVLGILILGQVNG